MSELDMENLTPYDIEDEAELMDDPKRRDKINCNAILAAKLFRDLCYHRSVR